MNKFSQFPHYPRALSAFPRYHPPYPLPYAEVPEPMSYTIYPSDAGFNAPAPSPHYYTKRGFTPSAGARFVRSPYEYENPYNAHAEDIQYGTVQPLVEPIPYTRQWQSGWGSANQSGEAMGGFWSDIGKKVEGLVGKGKTKRSARKSSRKARKAMKKRSGKAFSELDKSKLMSASTKAPFVSKSLMQSLSSTPPLDAVFQMIGPSSGLTGRNTFLFAKSLAVKKSTWDKSPLPRRTSKLFQGKTLQTQPIAKPILQALDPQQAAQQSQMTARAQESEKSETKAKKSNVLLWGGVGLATVLAAGGGIFWYNKKKKQGSQYQYYGPTSF